MSNFPNPCPDQENSLRLARTLARTASGFASNSLATSDVKTEDLAALAAEILDDPIALRQLGDRVFELLRIDLRRQQERNRGYGR